MDAEYSKRELDSHFKELGDKIQENTDITRQLNIKVGIQNGQVGKLESKWTGVVMAGTVLVFLLGLIMSLIVYSFNLAQSNQEQEILLRINKIS